MRGELGGERKTGDSRASSKRSDSATGSPLTLPADNMWPIIRVVHFSGENRDPEGRKKCGGRKDCSEGVCTLTDTRCFHFFF